jgi:hypothetical protein
LTTPQNREDYAKSFLDFGSVVSSSENDATGDKADPKPKHLSLETSRTIEQENPPSDDVDDEITPNTRSGRHTAYGGFRTEDVPDLSGLVLRPTSRPVFEGTYSTVYRGEYRNEKVRLTVDRHKTYLISSGRHQNH